MKVSSFFSLLRAALVSLAGLLFVSQPANADTRVRAPTIVLVHGAFADASSWNGVIPKLQAEGYQVIAVANPLRGLASDSAYVSGLVKSLPGPVILVGHSYGGAVISNAAAGNDNVKALVFVAGFATEAGESAFGLNGKYPGSKLGEALAPPVPLEGGAHDLYVVQAKFGAAMAADVPASLTKLAAATQRPIADVAGNEPSAAAAWKTVPSWFIYGSSDLAIPPQLHAFMAKRANARRVEVVPGASHVVMLSHPKEVTAMIREAALAAVNSAP